MQPQKRRNVFIAVVITAQTIVALLFLVFAFYQKAEADKLHLLVERHAKGADAYHQKLMERIAKQAEQIDSLETELNKLKAIAQKK